MMKRWKQLSTYIKTYIKGPILSYDSAYASVCTQQSGSPSGERFYLAPSFSPLQVPQLLMSYHVGVAFPPQSWKRKMTLLFLLSRNVLLEEPILHFHDYGTNRTKEGTAEVRPGQWTEGAEGESKHKACTRPGCSHSSEQKMRASSIQVLMYRRGNNQSIQVEPGKPGAEVSKKKTISQRKNLPIECAQGDQPLRCPNRVV